MQVLETSFQTFLQTGSRSNEKLKNLHGAIAKDILERLNGKEFSVSALGINDSKEQILQGRYIDKRVDITINQNGKPIAGVGVKFVMQNYSQNSNNYFENMLGETANIRSANIPYFQVFIIPDRLPYYNNGGVIEKWEAFSRHNVEKYLALSQDSVTDFLHTPVKSLLFVAHLLPECENVVNRKDYIRFYSNNKEFEITESVNNYGEFSNAVIYNDYETFVSKLVHYIKAL